MVTEGQIREALRVQGIENALTLVVTKSTRRTRPQAGWSRRAPLPVVRRARDTGLPIDRRDVIDDLDAGDGGGKGGGVAQVAGDELDAGRLQLRRAGGIADERAHIAAAGRQSARQMAAGESRCAGYEDLHR